MANLTITGVLTPGDAEPVTLKLGETCAAFDLVYRDDVDNKYYLSDATLLQRYVASHILLFAGGADDYRVALPLTRGTTLILIGPTLVVANSYVISATAGKIADRADLVSTNFLNELGAGSTTANMLITNNPTGIEL